MQEHRYGKSQPENVGFLKRIRTLLDQFDNRTTVGEIGDSHKGMQLMEEYTSGGDKLHMAYTFDMLGDDFTAEHFREKQRKFFMHAPNGWPCWAFSNHDVNRHVSRWTPYAADQRTLSRQAGAMLLSFKGSICLYQGEELGLPEADLLFEELTDPPGIRFWPEYKGRDGCRTPIPWEEGEAPNGFSSARPWLPVKPAHSSLNVAHQEADPASTLHFYRAMIAFRKAHPVLTDGDIEFFKVAEPLLAFRRFGSKSSNEALTCLFNLSADPITVTLTGAEGIEPLDISEGVTLKKSKLTLAPNAFAFLPTGDVTPTFSGRRKR
jgi:alpha-glucosidase